ncbi:MAG: hypothetical protein KDC71_23005, partial [Acidobacteria bacterium]|nr:hypothetical protein [Acidobacteriota bacterium]
MRVFAWITLLLCCSTWAQTRLGVESFSTSTGLVHNQVKCLLEDREGFLWIGTQGGLSRFDGFYFENFSFEEHLGSDSVLELVLDPTSGVWVVTSNGVAFWDGQEFQFPAWNQSLSEVSLKFIKFTSDGRMWLASRTGLSFIWNSKTGGSLSSVPIVQGKEVSYLAEQSNGDLWCGLRFDGLVHYRKDADQWSFVDAVRLPAPNVNFLAEDDQG